MSATVARQSTAAVPPQNLEAERSGLGAILLDARHLSTMILDVGLTEDDFYREAHGHVFAAMRALQQANEPIDYLTVCDQLEHQGQLEAVGGRGAVEELAGCTRRRSRRPLRPDRAPARPAAPTAHRHL